MKKKFGEYYLGIDMGTDSIGWAITDLNYNLYKFNSKNMWGVRLFEAGKTAVERRRFRSSRRRNDRKVQRIKLLQELFADEISKVDIGFFIRLKHSKYHPEDKGYKDSFFADKSFSDKDYYKKFPTIFHLRKSLIENKSEYDIRLVYLALAHIVKNRGHFLFEGHDFQTVKSFSNIFEDLNQKLEEEFSFRLECSNTDIVECILKQKGINNKKRALFDIFGSDNQRKKAVIELMCGANVNLNKLFDNLLDEGLDLDEKKISISFSGEKYQEEYEQLRNILQENIYTLELIKAVYDWSVFADILKDEEYISFGKVKEYEKHKNDLKKLKSVIRRFCPEKYNEVFKENSKENNYAAYVGLTMRNGKKIPVGKNNKTKCTQDDFCKYINSILQNIKEQDEELLYIKSQLENYELMPKQISKNNVVIPYQAHEIELNAILENTSHYLKWLNNKDESGLTVIDKIKKLFKFRIPYYVGPINEYHKSEKNKNCWVVKKTKDKILPWNFDQIIDIEQSAEAFIKKMTCKCTYLGKEDVIPKNSLLYSKFMVLNELNNIKIFGEPISVDLKQKIYKHKFQNKKRITKKELIDYLLSEGYVDKTIKSDDISGIDGDFKNSLASYLDFKAIFKDKSFPEESVEKIIESIVLFGEDKKLLKSKVKKILPDITSEEEKCICNLKYSGWGRLSKEFLLNIGVKSTEMEELNNYEFNSIIDALWKTNYNLMQLLSDKFNTQNMIYQYNKNTDIIENITYSYENIIQDLFVSPAIKRSIWQTLEIVREITKIMGHEPKKVFVEFTRKDGIKGDKGRKASRKTALIELYKNCKDEENDWIKVLTNKLENKDNDELRRDRLYLYFTQKGRCMYSGERIDINELYNENVYDVDHIYPQSYVKDDSINNRVLVKRELNANKGDVYPLPSEIRTARRSFWESLYKEKFIEKVKYERLTRRVEFSDDEKAGFIARQLIEVSQSSKVVAGLLKELYPQSEIVYVKASTVFEFRNGIKYYKDQPDEKTIKFTKVREANDIHHAHDAYLNIVVGNVYNTKFTHSPINYIKNNSKNSYNMRRMYEYDVERDGIVAWKAGETGTMATVCKTMNNNRIQFTRHATSKKGGFFDQMPLKKGIGKGKMPLKTKDIYLQDTSKYGMYDNVTIAYFFLVEHLDKNKKIRTFEGVPVHLEKTILNKNDLLIYAIEKLELIEARILIPKVKINTLFELDGFRMHLSCKNGDQLAYKMANQLLLDSVTLRYVKKIVKFAEKAKSLKVRKLEAKITPYDGISREENIQLYDLFLDKLLNTSYNVKLSAQVGVLEKGRDSFILLLVEQQCEVLYELLKIFKCNAELGNLKMIGGAANAGKLTSSKKIVSMKNLKIINQSLTGLFEEVIEVDKL